MAVEHWAAMWGIVRVHFHHDYKNPNHIILLTTDKKLAVFLGRHKQQKDPIKVYRGSMLEGDQLNVWI